MTDPFAATCLASPDDPGPRLVWADWLEERGDPRGTWLRWSAETLPLLAKKAVASKRTPKADMGKLLDQLKERESGERLLRLAACSIVRWTPLEDGQRRVWVLLEDEHSRRAVAVAELFACGLVTAEELAAAGDAARAAAWDAAKRIILAVARAQCPAPLTATFKEPSHD